jgi:hypothetical protein
VTTPLGQRTLTSINQSNVNAGAARRAPQIDDRVGETVGILAGDLLYGVGDRGELVGAERRWDEHDAGMLRSWSWAASR